LIELDDTNFGFSIVANKYTYIQTTAAAGQGDEVTLNHGVYGASRNSFGNFYVQNDGSDKIMYYALYIDAADSNIVKFKKIYTTTENIKE
jgi:hypothetical protein